MVVEDMRDQSEDQLPVSLLDFDKEQLDDFVVDLGEPRFRAQQVWDWIYRRYAADFSAMTNLPKALREQLGQRATIAPLSAGDGGLCRLRGIR